MASKLPPLPDNENEYWEGAETNVNVVKSVKICSTHEFELINSNQVKCKKCPTGYVLGRKLTFKDGHIYAGKLLVA